MCTESSKGPNNHVCVVFGKFKSLRTPTFHAVVQLLNPAEFNLHVLDPKKEQQYVLNKFINMCLEKSPFATISAHNGLPIYQEQLFFK